MAHWLGEYFSWQFRDVLFNKGAPFLHACVCVCVRVCLDFCYKCLPWLLRYVCSGFSCAFTINKVDWEVDWCSVYLWYVLITLDRCWPSDLQRISHVSQERWSRRIPSQLQFHRLMFHIQTKWSSHYSLALSVLTSSPFQIPCKPLVSCEYSSPYALPIQIIFRCNPVTINCKLYLH